MFVNPVVSDLPPFAYGSNAGGGGGVVIEHDVMRSSRYVPIAEREHIHDFPFVPCDPFVSRETTRVYRFVTRSYCGRPRDTTEETEGWKALRAAGLVP